MAVENYDDIYTELKNSAPLLSEMKKVNGYEVPKDYFLHFSQFINEQVSKGDGYLELSEAAPLLSQIKKPIAAKLSDNYFNSLPEILLNKIRHTEVSQELRVVAPALTSFEKDNLYEVPVAYFEVNSRRIWTAIQEQERKSVAQPNSGWVKVLEELTQAIQNFLSPPKYVFAFAVCFGFLILGSIFLLNTDASDEQKIVAQLHNLNDDELKNYIAMNIDEIQEYHILQNSSEVDFSSFLENTKELNKHVDEYILSSIDEEAIGKELRD